MDGTAKARAACSIGEVLRAARRRRSLSQLDLALQADISARHLGFIEVGRSRPSLEVLSVLLDVLAATPSERNAALLHAGYSHAQAQTPLAAEGTSLLRDIVEAHSPNPALVMDADWKTLTINSAGLRLCRLVMPDLDWPSLCTGSNLDMIGAVGHPDGLLSHMQNGAEVVDSLTGRWEAECWARPSLAPRVDACKAALLPRYGDLTRHGSRQVQPQLPFIFDTEAGRLSFVAVQCIISLPQDVTLAMQRLELWYPRDEGTRRAMGKLAAGQGGARSP